MREKNKNKAHSKRGLLIRRGLLPFLLYFTLGFFHLNSLDFFSSQYQKNSLLKFLTLSYQEIKAENLPPVNSQIKNKKAKPIPEMAPKQNPPPSSGSPDSVSSSSQKRTPAENSTSVEALQKNEESKENLILPTSEVQFLLEPFIYDASQDRRDPFVAYEMEDFILTTPGTKAMEATGFAAKSKSVPPLRQFALNEFSLKGILWDVQQPLAMFEDPRRVTHFVKPQDPIGNRSGYVAAIREGEVLVVEYFFIRGIKKSEVKRITLGSDQGSNPAIGFND